MKEEQLKRYNKLSTEEFYLLNKSKIDHKLVFEISGSTKNLYKVSVYEPIDNISQIFCTCPDKRSHASKQKCLCKHELFVLIKVLKVIDQYDEIFDNQNTPILYGRLLGDIHSAFEKLDVTKLKEVRKDKVEIKPDEICGVCFDDLAQDPLGPTGYWSCKVCKHTLHQRCHNKWFNMGNRICVYCRSFY